MPSKKKILQYWETEHLQLGHTKQGSEWGVCEHECFACGNFILGLHRAHIKALVNGGSNDVSNLHLLCPQCHIESEGISDYWKWMEYKRYYEWKYPYEHLFRYIKMQNIDIGKEGLYLESINATNTQIEEHIHNIFDQLGFKKINTIS